MKLFNKFNNLLLICAFVGISAACPGGNSEADAGAAAADSAITDSTVLSDSALTADRYSAADSAVMADSANNTDGGGAGIDAAHQIIAACGEISATDCFANMDCAPDQRCQNMGDDVNFVPCCVDGARGTDPAGSPCSMTNGELTCASGLCIDGSAGTLCSGTCSDVSDCPDNMQLCQLIAYSNSSEQWCFPQ